MRSREGDTTASTRTSTSARSGTAQCSEVRRRHAGAARARVETVPLTANNAPAATVSRYPRAGRATRVTSRNVVPNGSRATYPAQKSARSCAGAAGGSVPAEQLVQARQLDHASVTDGWTHRRRTAIPRWSVQRRTPSQGGEPGRTDRRHAGEVDLEFAAPGQRTAGEERLELRVEPRPTPGRLPAVRRLPLEPGHGATGYRMRHPPGAATGRTPRQPSRGVPFMRPNHALLPQPCRRHRRHDETLRRATDRTRVVAGTASARRGRRAG